MWVLIDGLSIGVIPVNLLASGRYQETVTKKRHPLLIYFNVNLAYYDV